MVKIPGMTLAIVMTFAIVAVASASGAEPVTLSAVQMDRVAAGAKVTNEPGNFRYESDNVMVEMNGHEGLAQYEVAETNNGIEIVTVRSSGSTATATAGRQMIKIGPGGVCVACANAAAIAATVLSAGSEAAATTGRQTIRVGSGG